MSTSSKTPSVPQPPSAGEEFEKSLEAFIRLTPQRRETELADLATQIELAQRAIPSVMALQERFAPPAMEQQIRQERQFAPEIAALRTEGIERDIAATEALAPRLRGVIEDPQTAAIRAQLGQQIEQELGLGATLDPSLRRETQEAVRSGQTARGMFRGAGPMNVEALYTGLQGEALRRRRQEAARSFLQTQAATAPDPFQIVTGRQGFRETSAFPGFQAGLPGLQMTAGGTVPGMADVGLQQQTLLQQQQFNLANAMAGGGGGGSGLGALLGGAAGFGLGGPAGAAAGASMGSQFNTGRYPTIWNKLTGGDWKL